MKLPSGPPKYAISNPTTIFLRIHRSYLVNRAFVTGFSPEEVHLAETTLPVSRKYRERVRALAEIVNSR